MTSVRCSPKNLNLEYAGKARTKYLCRVEAGHTIEDVLDPAYFGSVAHSKNLRVGDIIEIEWEDYSAFGELQVRAIPKGMAQLVCAQRSLTVFEDTEFPEGFEAEHKGGVDKWVITKDGKEVEIGFWSRDEAAIRAWRLDADARATQATHSAGRRVAKTSQKAKTTAKTKESEAA